MALVGRAIRKLGKVKYLHSAANIMMSLIVMVDTPSTRLHLVRASPCSYSYRPRKAHPPRHLQMLHCPSGFLSWHSPILAVRILEYLSRFQTQNNHICFFCQVGVPVLKKRMVKDRAIEPTEPGSPYLTEGIT